MCGCPGPCLALAPGMIRLTAVAQNSTKLDQVKCRHTNDDPTAGIEAHLIFHSFKKIIDEVIPFHSRKTCNGILKLKILGPPSFYISYVHYRQLASSMQMDDAANESDDDGPGPGPNEQSHCCRRSKPRRRTSGRRTPMFDPTRVTTSLLSLSAHTQAQR